MPRSETLAQAGLTGFKSMLVEYAHGRKSDTRRDRTDRIYIKSDRMGGSGC